eukprot:COSAG02_NODE_398_length_23118_cov_49.968939_6_plen_121_part_00
MCPGWLLRAGPRAAARARTDRACPTVCLSPIAARGEQKQPPSPNQGSNGKGGRNDGHGNCKWAEEVCCVILPSPVAFGMATISVLFPSAALTLGSVLIYLYLLVRSTLTPAVPRLTVSSN